MLPIPKKSWLISPNNRITWVSLNSVMSQYLFGVKEFLKTNGYLVKGSSNGTTGAMDNVDRWVTAANVTTRGAAAGNAQSWIVLEDANGVWILITYQGATDDIARLSYSPGQLFLAAGTPQNQPTAADEVVFHSAASLIGTNTVDRVWQGWVDTRSQLCRFAMAASGTFVGRPWGVERMFSLVNTHGAAASFTPPVWGFSLVLTTASLTTGAAVGVARPSVGGIGTNAGVALGTEYLVNSSTIFGAIKPELQGAIGYPIFPLSVAVNTSPARGKLGNLFDWWQGRTSGAIDGDIYGDLQFLCLSGLHGNNTGTCLWPWDRTNLPIMG